DAAIRLRAALLPPGEVQLVVAAEGELDGAGNRGEVARDVEAGDGARLRVGHIRRARDLRIAADRAARAAVLAEGDDGLAGRADGDVERVVRARVAIGRNQHGRLP